MIIDFIFFKFPVYRCNASINGIRPNAIQFSLMTLHFAHHTTVLFTSTNAILFYAWLPSLSLFDCWSWLALIAVDWVHHNLIWVLWSVGGISLGPIVADCVCEDVSVAVECCSRDCATGLWVTLKSVLSVLIPEVECTICTCSAERAVDRVEGNGINCVDIGHIGGWGVAVTLKGEVGAKIVSCKSRHWRVVMLTSRPSLLHIE